MLKNTCIVLVLLLSLQSIYNELIITSINLKQGEQKMRKILAFVFIAVIGFMTSCGPSASEIKAKHIADSTKVADSLKIIQTNKQAIADSLNKIAIADSLKKAEAVVKVGKPSKKHNKTKK